MTQFAAPKPLEDNKRFRADILQKARTNPELQANLIAKCREDVTFFTDTFCWTFDPRLSEPVIPFILYPKQERFLQRLDELYERSLKGQKISLVLDKPRAVGATFTFIDWCLHKYLFHTFNALLGSRKQDYVDKRGDSSTLFAKLDFMLERLPRWMVGEHNRTSMMITKEGSENQIGGESSNEHFSRGGRYSVVGFDEMAFWETPKSAWESSGESTNFRVAMSTPPEAGKDAYFYKLLAGQKGRIEKFAFDWEDVPSRDAKWLQEAQETKSEEEFMREVLKSYEGTVAGKVYARTLKLATITDECEYDPTLPLFCSWDFGLDTTCIIWIQKDLSTGKVYVLDSYHNANKEIDFFVPFVKGDVESGVHEYEEHEMQMIERHKKWTSTVTHFGDPDVAKRDLKTKISTREWLRNKGVYIQSKPWAGRKWVDLRNKCQMMLRRTEFNETRNEYLLSALRSARYPKRPENSQTTNEIQKPIHDWTSHFRSAMEYYADNEPTGHSEKTIDALRDYGRRIRLRNKMA